MIRSPRPRGTAVGLLACAALLGACHSSPKAAAPYDAGGFFFPDSGYVPPVCTVGCNTLPDAGADGGYVPLYLAIGSVVPGRGPALGGTALQMVGQGFMNTFAGDPGTAGDLTTLRVGPNPALSVEVISDSVIELSTPPGAPGPADVVLTNPNGTVTCHHCFDYFAPVVVQSISPSSGPVSGGTAVTLVGTGFTPNLSVVIGDRAATAVALGADGGFLTAYTPPGDLPGPVQVRVFNQTGTSSLFKGFDYLGAPRLTGSSPAGGPLEGGTLVTVSGAGLGDATACSFGGVPGTQLRVQSDSALLVTAPPATAPGPVDVSCTNPEGSGTLRRAFVYFDPAQSGLQLLGVSPTHGPAAGGNQVTLVGSGLSARDLAVTIGGQVASYSSVSDNLLAVTVPPGTAHTHVAVQLSSGALLSQAYTYDLVLQAIDPSHGPLTGGTPIELEGQGFNGNLALAFGSTAAPPLTLTSDTRALGISPAGTGGEALVRLYDVDDPEDEVDLSPGFAYDEPLSVGPISPPDGSIAGGTRVTVYGTGFAQGTSIRFGPVQAQAKDVEVQDTHTITCTTPAENVGTVDVVAALGNASQIDPQAYSYVDPTNQGGGSSGEPIQGTLNVTVLDGTGPQYGLPVSGASVLLGSDPNTPFQGVTDSNGQITFSDPAIVKSQTVTVSKDGYGSVTVVDQSSANLTLFISQNDSTGGNPMSGGGQGPQAMTITGKVYGFKPPFPLSSSQHAEAHVAVAPPGLYFVEPLGYTYPPQPEERTVLNADGQSYLRVVTPGLYAVYALYGVVDDTTGVFTPYLMGLHRDIEVDANHPAAGDDIILDMHLDETAPIDIQNPLLTPGSTAPALNGVYSYLDLGAEGVVPLGGATSLTPELLYTGLPEVDGSNVIFLNQASDDGNQPSSVAFVRQPGDMSLGVSVGPMLGFIELTVPSAAIPTFTGSLAWTYGAGPPPDLTAVQISDFDGNQLWSIVLPGADTQVSLPSSVLQGVLAQEPPGSQLAISLQSIREARFDYGFWTYADLSELNWIAFSSNSAVVNLASGTDGGR